MSQYVTYLAYRMPMFKGAAILLIVSGLFLPLRLSAQLTWGLNGAGGAGTWNSTTADWYNGASNVTWVPGDVATFGGTGGLVTLGANEVARALIFSNTSAGYYLQGQTIQGAASGLTLQMNQSAVISSSITAGSGATLTETGSGTLYLKGTISGFNTLDLGGTIDGGTIDGTSSGLTIQTTAANSLDAALTGVAGTTLTESGANTLTLNSNVTGFNTLNVSGVISGGQILGNASGMSIEGSGTINSSLTGASGTVLTKIGNATLTLGQGVSGFGQVELDAGTLVLNEQSSSDFDLSNSNNVVLQVNNAQIGSLNGGASSSIVEATNAGSSSLGITYSPNSSSFAGVLQDNGSNKLSLTVFGGSQTLTGTNTYSGSTDVEGGTLILSGNGSIADSSVSFHGGTLEIDDSANNLANRLSATSPLVMGGGTFLFQGSSTSSSTENFGSLDLLYYASRVQVNAGGAGQTALVTFAGISNTYPNSALIDFSGTGTTRITGISNVNGIIGDYTTYGGTEWASLDSSQDVIPLAVYQTNINSAASTDNVKISGGGPTTLHAPITINTINLQNSSGVAQSVDLGGNNLDIESGGILSSGSSPTAILDGTLSTQYNVLIDNSNTLTLGAALTGNAALAQLGTGTLVLTGINTYLNATSIYAGALQIGNGGTTGSLSSQSAISGSTLIFDRSNTITQGVDFSNSVYVTNLEQIGTGTLVLSANNNINNLSVDNGTVSINSLGPLEGLQPLGTELTINMGGFGTTGTLQYTGATANLVQNIDAVGNSVLVNSGGGLLTVSGTLTKADTVLSFGGGAFNITGQITGGTTLSFDSDLQVTHGSSVTLDNSNNNYAGPTDVNGGSTLIDGISNALPTGTVLILGNSSDGALTNTYDLDGHDQAMAALDGISNAAGTNLALITNSGTSGGNTVSLTGVNSDGSGAGSNFGGVIQDGSQATIALAVTGGTHVLTGANTYSGGTVISGGTLLANSGNSMGSGAVTVNSGGALGGNGTIKTSSVTSGNAVTIASGAVLNQSLVSGGLGTSTLTLNLYNTGATTTVDCFRAPSLPLIWGQAV